MADLLGSFEGRLVRCPRCGEPGMLIYELAMAYKWYDGWVVVHSASDLEEGFITEEDAAYARVCPALPGWEPSLGNVEVLQVVIDEFGC